MTSGRSWHSGLHFGLRRRVPVILQSDSTECGLVCIAMVARYHGHDLDVAVLRRRYPVSARGTSLARLIQIAHTIGLLPRPLRLELEGLPHLSLPCILHWNRNHYVVLKQVTSSRALIHDPTIGERAISIEELSRRFTGIALELAPGPDFRPISERQSVPLRAVMGRVVGLRRSLLLLVGLAVLLEGVTLLSPLFVQTVADQVLADGDSDLLAVLGVGFLLLLLLQAGITLLRSSFLLYLGTSLSASWMSNVFSHLLKLPEAFFKQRHVGDLVSRFGSISTIQQTLTGRFVEVVLDGLMTVITVAVLFAYSTRLALLSLGAVGLYIALRTLFYPAVRESTLRYLMAAAKQQSLFLECVRSTRAIRLHGRDGFIAARYANATTLMLNENIVMQRFNYVFNSAGVLIMGAQRVVTLWVGASLALNGRISVGMLLAFVAYSEQFAGRASTLIDYVTDLRMLRLQAERLAAITLEPPEEHVEGHGELPDVEACLELRDVGFRYSDTDPWILRGVNLSIQSGEAVAITGPSGSGKSTLAQIVIGLLDPEEGSVFVGGVDLRRLGKRQYRGMTGVVMQDDQLFAGSYADNISFFEPEASREDILAAARAAGIHEDIEASPLGYETLVGDMGSALSGGQRQRLILARALFRKPRILVLDEATSHLDSATEEAVNAAIRALGITLIVVAHRAATVAMASRVVRLTDCHVEEVKLPPSVDRLRAV